MKKSTFNTLLVGGGFLLGTAGIKLLTSAPVKNACVQGIACGMMTWLPRLPTSPRARPLLTRQPSNAPRHKL